MKRILIFMAREAVTAAFLQRMNFGRDMRKHWRASRSRAEQ
jgi:hypothetical protein